MTGRSSARAPIAVVLIVAGIALAVFGQTGSPIKRNARNPFELTNPISLPLVLANDNVSSTDGSIYKGTLATPSTRFLHNYAVAGTNGANVFLGIGSGGNGGATMTKGMAIVNVQCVGTPPTTQVCAGQTPLVVSTTAPHALFVGATVTVSGVLGDTAANGTYLVSAINPFVTPPTFTLGARTTAPFDVPTGNGTYTSGGTLTWNYQASTNTCIGNNCLHSLTLGTGNTTGGVNAGYFCTTCWANNLWGVDAGASITTGYENDYSGNETGSHTTSGHSNTAHGAGSLLNCVDCAYNAAYGADSLQGNISSPSDSAFGTNSCNFCSGQNVSAFGAGSAVNVTDANFGTFIGAGSGIPTSTQRAKAGCIGYNCQVDQNNSFVIGGPNATIDAVIVGISIPKPFEKLSLPGNIDLVNPTNGGTANADLQCIYFRNDGDHATSRRAKICAHAYGDAATIGLDLYTFKSDGTGAIKALSLQNDGMVTYVPIVFAVLGTPATGTLAYCSDCTKATPCAAGGTGAFAKRVNSGTPIWDCN